MTVRRIAIMSAGNGVGKTTTARNLGFALANRGNRVLLIDAGCDHTLTRVLNLESQDIGLAELIIDKSNDMSLYSTDDYIVHVSDYLDCITSTPLLSTINLHMITRPRNERLIQETITTLPNHYDYMLIDCQPGLGLFNSKIFDAVGRLILPTLTTTQSLHDLHNFLIAAYKLKRSGLPEIEGILLNRAPENFILDDLELAYRGFQRSIEKKTCIFHTRIPELASTSSDSYIEPAYDNLVTEILDNYKVKMYQKTEEFSLYDE